jgi:hypothetical protein
MTETYKENYNHTLRSSIQNGIKQQPSQQPKSVQIPQITHGNKPFLLSTRVTIYCWQLEHVRCIGIEPGSGIKLPITGVACGCCC